MKDDETIISFFSLLDIFFLSFINIFIFLFPKLLFNGTVGSFPSVVLIYY